MNKILFVYDPDLSKKNRQFTVRLSQAVRAGKQWALENPAKIYYVKDLARIASIAADKTLLKIALDSEMGLRKLEARFHSSQSEYTCLRIQTALLHAFITDCRQKQILVHGDGRVTDFRIFRNILPELSIEGDRFDLLLAGQSFSEKDYIVAPIPVTVVSGNRIVQLKENITHSFLAAIPIREKLTESRRESLLMEYSMIPGKVGILSGKQKEEKYTSHDDGMPVLDFKESLTKAKLIFFYGRMAVKDTDTRQMLYEAATDARIIRDSKKESEFRERLLAYGFFVRPKEEYNWFLSSRSLSSVLPVLEKAGFHVMVNHRNLTHGAELGWKVSADKDHIHLKARETSHGSVENPEALFAAFRNHRLFYEKADGSCGLISDEIRSLLAGLSLNGTFTRGGLRFNRRDFSWVGEKLRKIKGVETDPSYGALQTFARDFDGIQEYAVPETLADVLRPYQTLGFNWLKTLNHLGLNGILADDMGLGKTLQILCLLQSLKTENRLSGPVLLIVPKTLMFNWELEVKKFTPSLSCYIYAGPERSRAKEFLQSRDLVLTSYGLVRTETDFFQSQTWGYIILDEAQAIKNPRAEVARAIKAIACEKRLVITGTPVENSPTDLWSLFDFLMPGFLYGLQKFKTKYGTGKSALAELHTKTRPYILRRLKKDVLKELPPKTEVTIFCDFTNDQKTAYHKALEEAREDISTGQGRKPVEILRLLTKLRQIACHPELVLKTSKEGNESGKTEAVCHLAESILAEGHKILVFSQFTGHLKLVENAFHQTGLKTFYLDGQTRDRAVVVQKFQSFKGASAFFISLKTGGTGLNLHEADYVFLLDPWWNPAVENQAIDRCHRIGQKQPVTVYRFITRGSIEEKVMALKQVKNQMVEAVIQAAEPAFAPLDEASMRDLIFSDG